MLYSAEELQRFDPDLLDRLEAELEAEQKARANTRFQYFAQWRNDPVGFIQQGLLGFIWSKQREIALSVRDNRRTAVKSAHDTGKSYIASRILAWWCSCHDPGDAFAVSMAPTFHQVKGILWRELQKAHTAGGLPGTLNMTEWKVGPELIAFGRSPADTDPTAIQGIHAARVLVVGDEACGLSKAILDAADSLIANDDSRILLIGNPDDPSTEFAEICKPGSGWNVIRIDAFDTPNFTGEEVPDSVRPLLVSRTWVEEKRKSWGEESPIWTSKVRGDFPDQASDSLVPLSAINAAKARFNEEAFAAVQDGPHDLGIDVARMGDDSSVFYRRKGYQAKKVHSHKKRDLMELVGQVVRICALEKPKRIKIDDVGMGGGVTDRLREIQASSASLDPNLNGARIALMGVQIVPINVGEGPASSTGEERFGKLRDELNWGIRKLFVEEGGKIAVDDNDDLLSQATQIKYKVESTGEIKIEKKADMKKRTKGKSPDDWDALVLAFAEPSFENSGLLDYYVQQAARLAPPKPIEGPPTDSNGGVRLSVPEGSGFSTVYGMTGKMYQVQGGQIVVIPDDVAPLLGQGFMRLS